MFSGLSAFPLTPLQDDSLDEISFARIIGHLAGSAVDSITVLGSTGSYAYLNRPERANATQIALELAGTVPVFAGIGALRTRDVVAYAEDAQRAGVAGVLLPAMSYQRLTEDDVYGLFATVTANLDLPLIVYDNPGTTHFEFTDDLYARIANLPHVASIKIPGVPESPVDAARRVTEIRARVREGVTIGVSGDALAATGLNAGCDAWYSVIAGTLPGTALAITRAAQGGQQDEAVALSRQLEPLWAANRQYGSLRVVAALAEHIGLTQKNALPLPIVGLSGADRDAVIAAAVQSKVLSTP
ncbi:dihydrodipicolinate synthase family protein [Microbacterium paraoxydans]|uniref:dihydrodipicolinate synthase family protein n=1 Tax=Microbacterium paraoxydans TaxID=199592 RepID=UPI001CF93434|nr:dihydrodipicolinate synthase family protein [Microbacterium paraoxydans]